MNPGAHPGDLPTAGSHGLIIAASNADLASYEAAKREAEEAARQQEQVKSSMAAHVRRCWEAAKAARRDAEERMLKALRQREGIYDAEKLAEIRKFGGSELFIRLTDMKCRAAAAWIMDVLNQERPWDLEPTVEADIDPQIEMELQNQAYQSVMMQAEQAIAMGAVVDQAQLQQVFAGEMEKARDAAIEQAQKEARERAEGMAKRIEDQFSECRFGSELKTAIERDLVTLGTCVLRGPVERQRRGVGWMPDPMTGQFTPQAQDIIRPEVERVSPLDVYPSEDSMGVDDGYLIERYRVSRRTLGQFRGVEGYNSDAIDRVLDEYGRGGLREWTEIDSEREEVALQESAFRDGETIDVLIFWGDLQGRMLLEFGMRDLDPLKEYGVVCWLVGNYVIYARLHDDPYGRPYCKAVFEEREGSFFGKGIPELMEDVQLGANAAMRALVNNMAIASGPQVGVDDDRLPPGEDGTKLWPWKVWPLGQALGDARLPISFFQPEMHSEKLIDIYRQFASMADEVTGVPAYVQGDSRAGGAGDTASGLSMLMGAASRVVKLVVGNIDSGLVEPLVRRFFGWNMLYDPDPSIKGDVNVVARGANRLAQKEQQAVRRNEFLQATNNPVDVQIMGLPRRAELLRSIASTLDLDPDEVAPSREEMERQQALQQAQLLEQQAQMQARELGPDGQPVSGQDHRLFNPEGQ